MKSDKKLVPKKRFKEFENDDAWEQLKLGEVVDDLYNGQTPSRIREDYWKGNINWLTSGELNRGVVTKTAEKITLEGKEGAHLRVVPQGTFVMAITGLEAAGTRGNCAILGIDTTLNQSCMAVFPSPKLLDSNFLFQWYRKNSEEYGIKYTQGTKQQSYNAEIVKKLKILLPCIEEQKKIVGLLDNLDNLITLQQRKLEKIKVLKSAYLSDMFPKEREKYPKLRFAGFTDPWEQRKLGEMGKTFTGLSGKTKDDFGHGHAEFVTYMNVFSNSLANTSQTENVEIDDSQNEVEYGDVFFTTSSETPEEVGMSSVWLGNKPNVYLNSFCFGYRPMENLDPYYMAYMLRSTEVRKKFIFLSQGISRYNISKIKVMELSVPVPKNEEQVVIGRFFNHLDNLITLHQRKQEKLENIKKAYLNEMFV